MSAYSIAIIAWTCVGFAAAVLIVALMVREALLRRRERRTAREDRRRASEARTRTRARRRGIKMVTQDEVKQNRARAEAVGENDQVAIVVALEDYLPILALAEVHAAPDGVLTHEEKEVELGRRFWEDIRAVCPGEAPPLDELSEEERVAVGQVFGSVISAVSVLLSAQEARRRAEFLASAPPVGD